MRHTVGVADMKISGEPGDIVVTHALGSCLGITLYDPEAKVGGLLHVMLPQSKVNPEKAETNPFMFVDTGVPRFFKEIYKAGGKKDRLEVKVAGGSALKTLDKDTFNIGKRNFVMLRQLFWKNRIMISNKDVGGQIARTLYLEIGTGKTWLQSNGNSWEL